MIPICCADDADSALIAGICAGLEEEAVPFHVHRWVQTPGMDLASVVAGQMSALQVGIGVESNGGLVLYHEKLGKKPYLTEKREYARRLGKNAARLVKGLPLYLD